MLSDNDLRELADHMRRSGICLLDAEQAGQRVRLRVLPPEATPEPGPPTTLDPSVLVKASSMGVFRRTHPDGLFARCEVRTAVSRFQILGFVQVGLVLLPVVAPQAGEVSRILVPDNAVVGYGSALYELEVSNR